MLEAVLGGWQFNGTASYHTGAHWEPFCHGPRSRCDFNKDFGLSRPDGEYFGLSVFLRDGDEVFRTYFTDGRGSEALGSGWTFLDLTPFGRQEEWEDTPEGRPQTPPYQWWRRHDEYGS